MSDACGQPIAMGLLLDYFAGELDRGEEDRVEAHLFRCAACSSEAERLAGILATVSAAVPPVLSSSRFDALEREGRVQAVNVMQAGERTTVSYPEPDRLLVHCLSGLDLARARRVDLELRDFRGREVAELENVPFDRERGRVVVACQSHFAEIFPHDVIFTVVSVSGERREILGLYDVEHREGEARPVGD